MKDRLQSNLMARLAIAARPFRTVTGQRFVLRHDSSIESVDVALVHRTLELEIGMMEKRFGRRLMAWRPWPSRLPVYLFRSAQDLAQVYGKPAGGFACWHNWLIAVQAGPWWDEAISH